MVVWTVLSLGIYGAYWWYQVNREMVDLGRERQRDDLGDSPGTSLLAFVPGFLIIVPPFVSLYKGCQRVQAAQDVAGIEEKDRLNGWIALVVLIVGMLFVFVPLIVAFIQSELNRVWENETITDDPAGVLSRSTTPAPMAPAPAPAAPAQPGAPVAAPEAEQGPAPAPEPDPQLDRLERLAALRDSGAISAEEYEEQKAKILGEL